MNGVKGLWCGGKKGYTTSCFTWNRDALVLENYINGKGYLNLSEEGGLARAMAHEIIVNLDPLKIVWGNEVNQSRDQWADLQMLLVYIKINQLRSPQTPNKPKRGMDYRLLFTTKAYSTHKEQYDR